MTTTKRVKPDSVNNLLRALADPTRQEIVQILSHEGQQPAAKIYEHFRVSQPAISQHLSVLRESGILKVEKKAQYRVYSLNTETILELEEWTTQVRKMWETSFNTLERVLEAQKRDLNKMGVDKEVNEKEIGLKDVEIVWNFNAPVEMVWNAFTDPKIEVQWARCLVPVGSTELEFLEHDLRVGGRYLLRSVTPWSKVQYLTGIYKKIIPLKELVYTNSFADEKGNMISGPEFDLDYDIPTERLCEITFEPFQDWTKINLIYRGLPSNGHSDWAATEIGKSLTQLSGMIDQHY